MKVPKVRDYVKAKLNMPIKTVVFSVMIGTIASFVAGMISMSGMSSTANNLLSK